MAFIYSLCVCVVFSVVFARSITDDSDSPSETSALPRAISNDSGDSRSNGSGDSRSESSAMLRVKRSILTGISGNGCPTGTFRFHKKCITCKDIGKIHKRDMKICHGKCIVVGRACEEKRW